MYTAHEIDYAFRDQDTKPCFGVHRIADRVVSQLDKIVTSKVNKTQGEKQSEMVQSDGTVPLQVNNLCMFGIFGQWGRGKTYLWHQMRDIIKERNADKKNQYIHYDIVEFNAWKYQDTPALWAYLYQTICNAMPRMQYMCYVCKLWKTWQRLLFIVAIACLVLGSTYALLGGSKALIPTGIAIVPLFVEQIIEIYRRGKEIVPRNMWEGEYQNTLGIQNKLEKDLEKLLCTWVCKRRINRHRILLYVDDIDRCEEDKMISILDSLRTILENPEIQKRLVVVCSIDKDRISAAIQKKYFPTHPNDGSITQRDMVTEQLDKLFIFSVGLPQLDTTQQQRFVDCLYQDMPLEQDALPYSTARRDASLFAFHGQPQEKSINENIIADWLKRFVNNEKNSSITPRKLRIIYYRMLFANNLLADKNEVYFTVQFAKSIFDHSIHRKIDDTMINKCLSDVLEMVVPY